MRVLHSENGIDYGPFDKELVEGAVDCVSEVFTQNEPLAAHLGITKEEFLVFANAYYPYVAEDGLSFVARDQKTGQVVGIRVSEDYYQEGEPDLPEISEKFFRIFALLDELGSWFKENYTLEPGKYIHMFMIAVREGYTNRGIAPTMNRLFFKHVIDKGFTHAVTEPTGVISQHVLQNKFGFSELHRVDYKDWEFEGGEKPFADLEGHDCAKLLIKDLSELSL